MSVAKHSKSARRIVVFGATGHLGAELIERLEASDWPISELVAVASPDSLGETLPFRDGELDVVSEWPVLKGRDLVFICTPASRALEVVREALRAQVPCIDCTGVLSLQSEVLLPDPTPAPDAATAEARAEAIAAAPLLALASGTTLAWARILAPLVASPGLERVVGTVISSASAMGRQGVVALSDESIALFNQSPPPAVGPAGQAVAFDVIPGAGVACERVRAELQRLLGAEMRLDVESLQVPTFVGEGSSLRIELKAPISREAFEARLEADAGLLHVRQGGGLQGLEPIDPEGPAPLGPTLRDAAGADRLLVGRLEPDRSLPEGLGWRLFLASDPLRLSADHALEVAGQRLGLA